MDFIFKNFTFFKWWTYLYQVKQGCQRNTISCLIFCEIWLAKMLMRLVCTSFRLCVCLADNIYKLEDIIALLPFVKCICFLSIKFFILIACLCYLTFILFMTKTVSGLNIFEIIVKRVFIVEHNLLQAGL